MKYLYSQAGANSTPHFRRLVATKTTMKITQLLFVIKKLLIGREKNVHAKAWAQGFSLIETLVAITILLVVIVGPLSITSTTARSTSFASDQVTAFFLAQEGAELIQKVRDDFLLRQFLSPSNSLYLSNPWAEFTRMSGGVPLQACYTAQGCAVEIADGGNGTLIPGILPQCGPTSCQLYYDETTSVKRSRYTYTAAGATITPFTRVVKISIISPYEVRVTSEVTWRSGLTSVEQKVSVVNHLFNVYAN